MGRASQTLTLCRRRPGKGRLPAGRRRDRGRVTGDVTEGPVTEAPDPGACVEACLCGPHSRRGDGATPVGQQRNRAASAAPGPTGEAACLMRPPPAGASPPLPGIRWDRDRGIGMAGSGGGDQEDQDCGIRRRGSGGRAEGLAGDIARLQAAAGAFRPFACHPEEIGIKTAWALHDLAQASVQRFHL